MKRPTAPWLQPNGSRRQILFLNPNHGPAASHCKRILMKTTFLICLCSIALTLGVLGQTPTAPATTPSAQASVSASAAASASVTPAVSPSATVADEDSIERSVSRKLKHRFGVTLNKHHSVTSVGRDDDGDMADAGMLIA